MLPTETNKGRPFNTFKDGYKNFSGSISNYRIRPVTNNADIKIKNTKSGYHYELKIPGYVKEDFNFYISNNDLVVTTERSAIKEVLSQGLYVKTRHSYCYPSAYFKRRFPLPENIVRDEILVDYKDEVLSFDLFKLKNKKE